MTVQINTDNNVEGHARLKAYISGGIRNSFGSF
jgi:hypothetical protein